MSVKVQCDSCKQVLNVKDSFAGKTGACPSCGQPIVVPSVSRTAEAAPAEPSDTGDRRALPATEKQKKAAQELGISFAKDIGRGELGRLIGEAKKEVILYATEKQKDLLGSYGVEIPENLTRDQASSLIDRVFDLVDNVTLAVRQQYDKQMKEHGYLMEHASEQQIFEELDGRGHPFCFLILDDDDFRYKERTPVRGKFVWNSSLGQDDAKFLITFLAAKWACDFDKATYAENLDGVLPAVELSVGELGNDKTRHSESTAAEMDVPELTEEPFTLQGNQLGISLADFKSMNHQIVEGCDEPAPWCREDPSTGLVHCRPAPTFEKLDGQLASTVAGIPTEQLIYSFVDNRLYKITASFDFDYTEKLRAALVAKYGDPDHEQKKNWTWDNGVSAIHLAQGNSRNWTTLAFIHYKLNEIAEDREVGPAVDDL